MAVVGTIYNIKQFDDYILQMYYDSAPFLWYNGSYILTGASDESTGEFNTPLIIQQQGTGTYASSVADSLVAGGFNDWYLPSIDELKEIENSAIVTSGAFWTSTEYDINEAYAYIITSGANYYDKSFSFPVLMVRKEYTSTFVEVDRMKVQSKDAAILRGGENNADEDVYKMLGGVNGISKNSNILSNE